VADKADVLRRFIYPLRTKPVKICPRGNDRFWRIVLKNSTVEAEGDH
jgi:hypothetical protein